MGDTGVVAAGHFLRLLAASAIDRSWAFQETFMRAKSNKASSAEAKRPWPFVERFQVSRLLLMRGGSNATRELAVLGATGADQLGDPFRRFSLVDLCYHAAVAAL